MPGRRGPGGSWPRAAWVQLVPLTTMTPAIRRRWVEAFLSDGETEAQGVESPIAAKTCPGLVGGFILFGCLTSQGSLMPSPHLGASTGVGGLGVGGTRAGRRVWTAQGLAQGQPGQGEGPSKVCIQKAVCRGLSWGREARSPALPSGRQPSPSPASGLLQRSFLLMEARSQPITLPETGGWKPPFTWGASQPLCLSFRVC